MVTSYVIVAEEEECVTVKISNRRNPMVLKAKSVNSTEALSCSCSNMLAGNWSTQTYKPKSACTERFLTLVAHCVGRSKPPTGQYILYCPVANLHTPVKPQMIQGDVHQNISHNNTSSCKHVQRMHQNVSQNDNKFFSKHVQRMYQNVRMIQVQTCTEDAHTQPTQTRA